MVLLLTWSTPLTPAEILICRSVGWGTPFTVTPFTLSFSETRPELSVVAPLVLMVPAVVLNSTVAFGTDASADVIHLRDLADLIFHRLCEVLHFRQRGSGCGAGGDDHGFLMECGQEVLAHLRIEHECEHQQHRDDGNDQGRLPQA